MADAARIMDRLAEIRAERRPPDAEGAESGDTVESVESGDTVQSGDTVESGDDIESGGAVESASAHEAANAVEAANDEGTAGEPIEEEQPPSRPVRVGDTGAPTGKAEADRKAPAKKAPTRAPSRTAASARKAGTSAKTKVGSLRGRVVDARTGRDVAGARVRTAAGPAAVSDRAGVFRISGLAAKSHRLRITAKGFVGVEKVVVVSRARPTALTVRLRPAAAAKPAAVRTPR
jgi:hypothetical protein